MNVKRPALLPEDGAKLIGNIRSIVGGKFQATCHAELDHRSHVESESQEYFTSDTFEGAKAWINAVAAARGFKTWLNSSGEN
jgi:hypothetical protein